MEKVLKLLAPSLKDGHNETIENLSDEMREDYLLSVKKAIGKSSVLCETNIKREGQIWF